MKVFRQKCLKGVISKKYIIGCYKSFGNYERLWWRGHIVNIECKNNSLYASELDKTDTYDDLGELELL